MSDITKFNYEGNTITFEFSDGNKMINATEMLKAFPSKRMDNFLRLRGTKDYILLLESRYADVREREVLRVIKGGVPELQGTWMTELLALKFATWLDPRFELWVFDRILELLSTGKTELQQTPTSASNVIKSIRLIADQLEEQAGDIQNNKYKIEAIEEVVQELEAKILSVDEGYYTIAGYCSLHKIKCPLHKAKEWGKAATALSKQKNVPTGTAHDERYGRVRTYHKDVLGQVIK